MQVAGPNGPPNEAYATMLLRKMRAIPGIADVRLQQSTHYPEFAFDVDRTHADQLGITERDVTNSLVANLSGTFQVAPAFWLNPKNGVSYPIVAQAPQYRIDSLSKMENIPVTGSKPGELQVLGGLGADAAGRTATRWCPTTPSSRPSTSMRPPKAATSARWPARSRR